MVKELLYYKKQKQNRKKDLRKKYYYDEKLGIVRKVGDTERAKQYDPHRPLYCASPLLKKSEFGTD